MMNAELKTTALQATGDSVYPLQFIIHTPKEVVGYGE
jgi:hypothetical protein